MINDHNAPNHLYNGYRYVPYVAHEDDEGIRKAEHKVVNVKTGKEAFLDASPYRWLSMDEFAYHIDMLFGNVYGDSK